jgi:pyruvate-formate lyase-activating enzyme
VRRRLSLASTVEDQVRRELVSLNREPGSKEPAEHIIRVNFHCNQACRFCFVSTHLPSAGHDAVEEAIREAGRRGLHIVLSGGEPTLNARLVDYVRLAKSVSSKPVELQTNAVRLDDEALVQALVEAGLDQVFVSLHGCTATISDRVTEAPGTFARTVIGVDHLTRAGVFVVLNFVICSANHEDLVPYVRWVAGRWPRATVNFSFVAASTDVVPRDKHLIPRYSDVLPHLAEALRLAKDLDLATAGFESMCGLPLCLVPADLAPYFQMELIPEGFDGGEFSYPPSCQECDLRGRCYGLRRGYEALHGSDELSAVRREPTRA